MSGMTWNEFISIKDEQGGTYRFKVMPTGKALVDAETGYIVRPAWFWKRFNDCKVFYEQPNVDAFIENHNSSKPNNSPQYPPETTDGYVYLMQSGDAFKIGMSQNPSERLRGISPILPYPVNLLCIVKTEDMRSLEVTLHERFADKRLNGEWFALSSEDIQYVKSLAE